MKLAQWSVFELEPHQGQAIRAQASAGKGEKYQLGTTNCGGRGDAKDGGRGHCRRNPTDRFGRLGSRKCSADGPFPWSKSNKQLFSQQEFQKSLPEHRSQNRHEQNRSKKKGIESNRNKKCMPHSRGLYQGLDTHWRASLGWNLRSMRLKEAIGKRKEGATCRQANVWRPLCDFHVDKAGWFL